MTSKDYIIVIIGYEKIYGFEGGGLERIKKEVSEYNLYGILETSSKIALRLFAKGMGVDNQVRMIKDIFADDLGVRRKIASAIKTANVPRWTIFAEQPLLNLFKIALEHSKKKGGKPVEGKDVQKVGHWLLILSDVCMGSESTPPLLVPADHVREQLREYLTHQYFFNAQERLPYRLGRFKDIFERIRKLHPMFDIDKKFSNATNGVELNDYISFCFFLLVKWVNITTKEEVDITKEWLICKSKYFENTKLTMNEIDSVLPLLLLDTENYKKDYDESVRSLLKGNDIYPFNFLQLRQKPLIPNGECFVCPSPNFFMDKATEGIYWILENYFKKENLKKDREALPIVWGDAFEEYVHKRLAGGFKKNYKRKPMFKKDEITDGLIYGKQHLFLVEVKYAHWSYIAKLTGKKEDMMNTLRQLFSSSKKIKGLGQLTRSIKKIESGEVILPTPLNKRKIISILVVGEGMSMDAYNRKMYEDIAKENGAFYESSITLPFLVLDAEEVEILEAIALNKGEDEAERLLSDYSKIFLRKTELGFVKEALQFKNYLDSINYSTGNNPNMFQLFENIHKIAKTKGFPKKEVKK